MFRNVLATAVATLLLLMNVIPPSAPAAQNDCKLHQGDHVVMYGSGDDPDVLAWDSRFRLREYHAASYDEAEQLLPHASLESPGTRALVVSCFAGFVQSRMLIGPQDAVGVMILNGPDRGLGKWVLGSDVRAEEAAKNHQ
jgi:hypothetical protein